MTVYVIYTCSSSSVVHYYQPYWLSTLVPVALVQSASLGSFIFTVREPLRLALTYTRTFVLNVCIKTQDNELPGQKEAVKLCEAN